MTYEGIGPRTDETQTALPQAYEESSHLTDEPTRVLETQLSNQVLVQQLLQGNIRRLRRHCPRELKVETVVSKRGTRLEFKRCVGIDLLGAFFRGAENGAG